MKPKLFTLLLAVAASVGTMFAWNYEQVQIGDLYYNLDATNQTAEVTSQNSSYPYWSTTITTANIPSSVTYNSVSYSVTSIGNNAFFFCSGLTSVTIPNSVTSIGEWAFHHCTGLTSVTIPNSVTSIGESAFWGCSGLTSVTIPNSVTSIGLGAFYNCTSLTSLSVEAGNTVYDSRNNCNAIIETSTNTLIFGCQNTTIPNSVTSIGDYAFSDCSGLTSVTIPNSVTSIGYAAFKGCSSLTSVTIPNSVTSIGGWAFSGCSGLTSVTIPNSVTSIGESAFWGCSGLTSVTIPNSVTSIGLGAFYNCTSLTSLSVEAGNTVYDSRNNCNAIIETSTNTLIFGCQNTTIPNSVTSIGDYAFSDCSGLTSVTIPNSVTSIGYAAFKGCSSLTSVTIPNSVTSIGGWAFSGCSGLTSVTIPNSVTSIGESAFWGCSGLTSVTIEAETPPALGSSVFKNTNDCPIYVPCGTIDAYTSAWPEYANRIISMPLNYQITGNVNIEGAGSVQLPQYTCDGTVIIAVSNYGYHFTKWSDGNTDNPRTIVLTQDTTFTAEFAKNTYTISTTSANPEWGTTAGDTAALYLDEVEISAIPNYGYHFVRWNDNNGSNPRTVSVTEDKTYTATFAKNVYSITKNAEHGTISGNSSAEYLDFVTLTVTPDYGYHFTQWSDGLKDNPRIAQITQDTTFTAEFAYDRVGTCGKDLALVWSYDPNSKVLTIGNAGEFTENMQFGVEAPTEMEELVIGNSVTAIGANAFAGIETLKKVSIGESVKTIGEQAFFNCVNLETIFNYRPTPTNAYSNAFDGVDKFECKLYVLTGSIDMYKNASVWRDFYYTYAIGAEETTVTTNDVTVEPQDNAATVTWPTSENAASYTIQITKDGVVFCTLIFNGNGQLTGIAFAPSRDGQAHAPQAIMTANGMQFTVTGLDRGTHYALTLQAKDSQETVLASYSSEFTTTGQNTPQSLEDVSSSLQGEDRGRLILRNGQILILRGDKTYTPTGQEVK